MAKLILEGGDAREIALPEICRIGRDKGNELALDDSGLSRRHCRIFREASDYILEDLKSANGTFLKGERIDRVKLKDGDRITLGNSSLLFSMDQMVGSARSEPSQDEAELKLEEPDSGARFELVFVAGERSGERVRLVASRITFGRKGSNTVVLKDAKISGVHCEVALEDGRPVLRDLGSTNGTFLEGKRIDEIVLDHGDRIMLGEAELSLIDTAKGDPTELAREASDASQTMISMPEVHVVRDLTRSPKSPLALIGLLLTLAALGAGGWYYWRLEAQNNPVVSAPPTAGNLLGERWSFEAIDDAPDPADAWDFEVGLFRVASSGARSGGQLLLGEPGGSAAQATLADGLKISGRKYRISGFAKVTGEAVATLSVLFRNSADADFQVVVPVGSSRSRDWQEMSTELIPPTGSTHLALLLTASGPSGTVRFDDLGTVDAGVTRAVVESINQFEFERVGENLLVRRGSELLRIGPLQLRPAPQAPQAPHAPQVDSGDSGGEGEVRGADRFLADGSILLPNGRQVGYSSSLARDARSVDWRLEWSPGGAELAGAELPIDLLAPLLEEPLGVYRGGVLEPYLDSFEAEEVSGLVIGRGLTRMRLQFQPEVRILAARQAARYRLLVQPDPTGGRLLLQMQVDFVEEKAEAGNLVNAAREAQAESRLGEALGILNRIRNEFPFDEQILEESQRRQHEISQERERIETELQAAVARAAFLQSPTAYQEAESAARSAQAAFAGRPVAEQFAEMAADLATDRQRIVATTRVRSATQLLQRLETFLNQEPPKRRAAGEIAEYLAEIYPGSDPALEASKMLQQRKMQAQRSADGR